MILTGNSQTVTATMFDDGDTVRGVTKQVLIGPQAGAPNFAMRRFTVAPGGFTPYHTHAWEHEVYILSGHGVAKGAHGEKPVVAGDFVYVPPEEEHQFRNPSREPLQFLCMVPLDGEP
ncbi:cupin domain-containing protein [Candidatus Bipolaricaulota bacterium]|nr:cupin domain-containing protein [Candidatus Bipolaricaulota bacterium]